MGRAFEVRKQAMAKTQGKKSKLYAKYGKEIYMAAKGGVDVEANPNLKRIIEKARKDQVPSDIIKRAIDKTKGGVDENYIDARYEGFSHGSSMIIVECLTDNVNRTVAEVRNCFTKTGGKLGVSGSVIHQFEQLSVFEVLKPEEEVLEKILESEINITDVENNGSNSTIVYGNPNDYGQIRNFFSDSEYEVELEEISFLPLQTVKIENQDELDKINKLLEMLEDIEDVQNVFHNIEF